MIIIGPNITLLLIAVNLFLCLFNQVIGQYGLAILNIVAAGFLILHLHYLDDEDRDESYK